MPLLVLAAAGGLLVALGRPWPLPLLGAFAAAAGGASASCAAAEAGAPQPARPGWQKPAAGCPPRRRRRRSYWPGWRSSGLGPHPSCAWLVDGGCGGAGAGSTPMPRLAAKNTTGGRTSAIGIESVPDGILQTQARSPCRTPLLNTAAGCRPSRTRTSASGISIRGNVFIAPACPAPGLPCVHAADSTVLALLRTRPMSKLMSARCAPARRWPRRQLQRVRPPAQQRLGLPRHLVSRDRVIERDARGAANAHGRHHAVDIWLAPGGGGAAGPASEDPRELLLMAPGVRPAAGADGRPHRRPARHRAARREAKGSGQARSGSAAPIAMKMPPQEWLKRLPLRSSQGRMRCADAWR